MNRPCLDPSDPDCPVSAPNKEQGEVGHSSVVTYNEKSQVDEPHRHLTCFPLCSHPFRVLTLPGVSRAVATVSAGSSCTGRRS